MMGLDQQTYEGLETSCRHTCIFQHSPYSMASTSENVVRLSHLIESAFWTSLYQSNDDQSTTSGLDHQHRCLRKSQALLDKLQTYNRQNRHLNKLQLRSVWLLFTPQNSHQQQTSLPPNSTRHPPPLSTDHSQHNNKTLPFLCDPLFSYQVDGLHYPYNPPILPCGLYILVRPIGMRT
jgi:hypothetical protein